MLFRTMIECTTAVSLLLARNPSVSTLERCQTPTLLAWNPRTDAQSKHVEASAAEKVVKLSSNVVRLSTSVKTALPEAAQTLEKAWQRRCQELAGWQPSGGWLVEPRSVRGPSIAARTTGYAGATSKD